MEVLTKVKRKLRKDNKKLLMEVLIKINKKLIKDY
jgi:hypothetical protein